MWKCAEVPENSWNAVSSIFQNINAAVWSWIVTISLTPCLWAPLTCFVVSCESLHIERLFCCEMKHNIFCTCLHLPKTNRSHLHKGFKVLLTVGNFVIPNKSGKTESKSYRRGEGNSRSKTIDLPFVLGKRTFIRLSLQNRRDRCVCYGEWSAQMIGHSPDAGLCVLTVRTPKICQLYLAVYHTKSNTASFRMTKCCYGHFAVCKQLSIPKLGKQLRKSCFTNAFLLEKTCCDFFFFKRECWQKSVI